MNDEARTTHQKALRVNLDSTKYGTFAEIGAGQEVARWFFRVGGASGTIAKAMSAYDMKFSDAIYGPSDRYVSRQRLQTMIGHEFELLIERLRRERGDRTRFFVFANTVAASSYTRKEDGNGWMGMRFQSRPGAEPSEIILHVRMLDSENLQQQEALGVLGVNLVHAALYQHDNPEGILGSLMDDLTRERVELDMIKFSGPDFEGVDDRLMSLSLVERGLTDAAMFTADGEVVQASEVLYKKNLLVERGSFRPVTHVTVDMLECARARFLKEPKVRAEDVVVLMEMTMKNLAGEGGVDPRDFLARVDLLGTIGKTVLISNYGEHYRLAGYLFRHTRKMNGIVMGIPSLREIFEEKYYAHLAGGILESFGRMFKNDLKLYVYPELDAATGRIITVETLEVAPRLKHLYAYLLHNGCIESIQEYKPEYLPIHSRDILARIAAGDHSWEKLVPAGVASLIKTRGYLGYRAQANA